MTITINYIQRDSPGYTPRKPIRVFNVEKVLDAGVDMVKVAFIFQDAVITHDHVKTVVIEPERED